MDGSFINVWNENAHRIRFSTIKKRPAMRVDLPHGSACGRSGADRLRDDAVLERQQIPSGELSGRSARAERGRNSAAVPTASVPTSTLEMRL